MGRRIAIGLLAVILSAALTACNAPRGGDLRMQEEAVKDRRGGMGRQPYDQNRVNTNLPKGGDTVRNEYQHSPNQRPGDASGGRPDTTIETPNSQNTDMTPSRVIPARPKQQ